MTEEVFAAVGAFATFAVAVMVLAGVCSLLIMSVKEWLDAKNELTAGVRRLSEVQAMLISANNGLNERIRVLEGQHEQEGDEE